METEQNPEELFRELMQVSQDGTVPEHLMARLKRLEDQRSPRRAQTAALEGPRKASLPTIRIRDEQRQKHPAETSGCRSWQ